MDSKWQLVTHAIHDEVDDLILCDGTHKVMTTLILLIFTLGLAGSGIRLVELPYTLLLDFLFSIALM